MSKFWEEMEEDDAPRKSPGGGTPPAPEWEPAAAAAGMPLDFMTGAAMEEDAGAAPDDDDAATAAGIARMQAQWEQARMDAIAAAEAAEATAAPAAPAIDRAAAKKETEEAMAHDPRLAAAVDEPRVLRGAELAEFVAGGAAKRGKAAAAGEDLLMDELERQLAGVKIGDRLFCKHRTIVWDSPEVTTVCVTPRYAVVLNQTHGHLEARWWAAEDAAGGGGLEHHRTCVLENSHGYLLDRLPSFSHAPGVVGVCEAIGRVEMWEPSTDSVLVSHPSAFAISNEYVVLATSDTPTTSSFYVRRWAPNPAIAQYGDVDTVWDKFKCSIAVPRFMRAGIDQPYDFFVVSSSGLGILNVLIPAPMRAVVPAATWYAATMVESGTDVDIEVIGIKTAANAFCSKMRTWASPDYRDVITGLFRHRAVRLDPINYGLEYTPASHNRDDPVVSDHDRIVMRMRTMELPSVPETYQCVSVSASGNYIVACGSDRLVWTDRDVGAHCPTDAVAHALDAALVPGGVVAITARPSLVYIEEPTGTPVNVTETLLRNDDTADTEFLPTIRPVDDFKADSPEMPGGAPPGTMIAIAPSGHIVCHAFDDNVNVYTIGEFEPTTSVAETVAGLSFDTDDEDIDPPAAAAGGMEEDAAGPVVSFFVGTDDELPDLE